MYHFFFLSLYFPLHIQLHNPHPRTSSPWSSIFFSFSLNSITHSSHPRTSSSWSSPVISLNFTKNLQYLSQPTPAHFFALIFTGNFSYFPYLSFQFSLYFVVSEMRIILVIFCISNGNIDQKRFCVCKSSLNLPARFGSILCISKRNFFEKAHFETLPSAWLSILLSKKCVLASKSWNKQVLSGRQKLSCRFFCNQYTDFFYWFKKMGIRYVLSIVLCL